MKRSAGEKAVEWIEDGMIIGLGTGSTVKYTIEKLGELVKNGLHIKGIPSSQQTKKLAQQHNIPLIDLTAEIDIDITIDGADEVDSNLYLIKGGGGALLREKIIAYHSKKVIIVVDESKIVKALGIGFPLPVEITRFGWHATKKALEQIGCTTELRTIMDEKYLTDNANYLLDCDFDRIEDPEALDIALHAIPGVVEHGLFINLVDEVIVGSRQGTITLERETVPA
ncbi:MAG: ribose-5-phosphate isomerase RpiA [Candidatus Thermoplasmatota archaeon]|nr:ribose-5-phosphate isomerase RpiA [Candidatus Thermoplasmatota archaeon]MBU1940908.1 ribose-5-phosphate isomerase RpiA [Candidatus Thermoplasmatota archaeon]